MNKYFWKYLGLCIIGYGSGYFEGKFGGWFPFVMYIIFCLWLCDVVLKLEEYEKTRN